MTLNEERAQAERVEELQVAAAMIRHGGSFVKHLGYALEHADRKNMRRIRHAFPDYWEDYKMKAAAEEETRKKAVHIDSVSDDDWDALARKRAQMAADGAKVI